MSGNKKPRKPYRPGVALLSAHQRVVSNVCRMSEAEIAPVVAALHDALGLLYRREDAQASCAILADAMAISESLMSVGVCDDPASLSVLSRANDALFDLSSSAKVFGEWLFSEGKFQYEALAAGILLHSLQLRMCTFTVYQTAIFDTVERMRAAMNGQVEPGTVVVDLAAIRPRVNNGALAIVNSTQKEPCDAIA